jgi:hypothetical protein
MKPTIPQVVARFADYYEQPLNGAWGSLHIVLDDDNVRKSDVEFCREHAIERGDTEGAALAEILILMSKTQRLKLGDAVHRFIQARNAAAQLSNPIQGKA